MAARRREGSQLDAELAEETKAENDGPSHRLPTQTAEVAEPHRVELEIETVPGHAPKGRPARPLLRQL